MQVIVLLAEAKGYLKEASNIANRSKKYMLVSMMMK